MRQKGGNFLRRNKKTLTPEWSTSGVSVHQYRSGWASGVNPVGLSLLQSIKIRIAMSFPVPAVAFRLSIVTAGSFRKVMAILDV
jgi:hypothetical protein